MRNRLFKLTPILIVIAATLISCQSETLNTNSPTLAVPPVAPATRQDTNANDLKELDLSRFQFPETIDPSERYLFYLHGKIIEDQGIPAVDPQFGEYQYEAILDKFASYGFSVISEPRKKDTDPMAYAKKVVTQVNELTSAGVPPGSITIVGASKGGGIAILVSNLLGNPDLRYVIMAICSPEEVEQLKHNGIYLAGRVLSIYDSADTLAGSCQDLFDYSQQKGLVDPREIMLKVGIGHGILYKPLDEWVLPVVEWAKEK
jgi:hypothetical protein